MGKLHDFVICNPELCIGCKGCMKACVKEATKRGKIAFARCEAYKDFGGGGGNFSAQCRQCDDAPCAAVCPTSALRNERGYVEVFERLCIGCGLCTVACPYGAIRLESEEVPSTKQTLADYCDDGFASVAVKCDICDGKEGGGSACVEVCPKGALAILRPSTGEHVYGKKLKNTASMSKFIATILDCEEPVIDLAAVAKAAEKPAADGANSNLASAGAKNAATAAASADVTTAAAENGAQTPAKKPALAMPGAKKPALAMPSAPSGNGAISMPSKERVPAMPSAKPAISMPSGKKPALAMPTKKAETAAAGESAAETAAETKKPVLTMPGAKKPAIAMPTKKAQTSAETSAQMADTPAAQPATKKPAITLPSKKKGGKDD